MTQYHIVLADDHQVVINGFKKMLETEQGLNVVQTVNELKAIVPTLRQTQPDLLILDVNMHGKHTFEVIPELKRTFPELKIMIFTSYNAAAFRKEAVRLDVNAFLTKNAAEAQIIRTIYKVLAVDDSKAIIPFLEEKGTLQKDKFSIENILSARELEILILVAQGNNSQQIAEQLFLSKHTIQWHRKKIIAKLELKSASEMIQFAYKHDLV